MIRLRDQSVVAIAIPVDNEELYQSMSDMIGLGCDSVSTVNLNLDLCIVATVL
jgi:hypothetical protein